MITVIPDGSALIQMVNFLILLFVLNLVLFRPIRNVLIERKAKIDGMRTSASGRRYRVFREITGFDLSVSHGLKWKAFRPVRPEGANSR